MNGDAPLLERDVERDRLHAAVDRAADGQGTLVLVSGEPGIGKTALVRAWGADVADRARVLTGACDDLVTPRVLGPFRDMARGSEGPLTRAFEAGGDRDAVLAAVQQELANPLRPTVLVIEDIQWADEATLDVLRYLGRRIAGERGVVVATYRDDLPDDHPLTAVVGGLVGASVLRLPLAPLTVQAVAELARGRGAPPDEVHDLTGGNPFLVTEFLAAVDADVPVTVRDAVAARLREVAPATQAGLEQLAVLPGGAEVDLVTELLDDAAGVLAEAEARGVLEVHDGRVRFRHELTRRAVEAATLGSRRTLAHAAVLAALRERDVEPSRVVHHAIAAGDAAAIVAFAPAAARRAVRAGAHRDAVRLYDYALTYADRLEPVDRATVRTEQTHELVLANRFDDALREAAQAVAEWEGLDDPVGLGRALTTAAHARYWGLDTGDAVATAQRAVAVLEPLGESAALARAHAVLAFVLVMANRFPEAVEPARRGVAIATAVGDDAVRAYALTQEGVARVQLGDATGITVLEEALTGARAVPSHQGVVSATIGLASGLFRLGRLAEAERSLDVGLAYADEHQLGVGVATLRMMRHGLDLSRGAWRDAERGLAATVGEGRGTGWGETVAAALLGRLRARRDESGAQPLLERAWSVATRSGEVQRVGPAGAALAEWGWLTGRYAEVSDRVDTAIELARAVDHRWYLGELLRYRALALADGGDLVDDVSEPWAAGIRGDWREAAAGWAERGWPYERAVELVASDQPDALLDALPVLDELGAAATATLVRRRLRDLGVDRIPRGPRAETREHPAGLTPRQVDVLDLLLAGATNAEIADLLVLSVRTVDHHVSAILAKLGVTSRREVAARVAEIEAAPPG